MVGDDVHGVVPEERFIDGPTPVMGVGGSDPSTESGDAAWRILVFPGIGRQTIDGSWRVELEGVIYQNREIGLRKRMLLRLLRRVMKADPAEFEHALFQSRVEAFVGMTDRGWQPEVRCGEDPFVSMRRTKRNGRFFGSIRVSDEKRRECIARRGNSDGHIEVRIQGVDQSLVQAPVYLVPRQGISVVSDIDDTIKHTDVRSRREMLLNTFVRPFSAIDGMAEAYQRLAELDFAFHYVSSSPWQLFTPLRMLLNDCSFPGGTIHLRNFALRDHMLRRVLPLHRRGKGAVIRHLIESFPERRFVLIGDSGERDPRIYAKLTQRYTSQIDSVLIRVLEPEHRGRLEEQWNRGDTLRGKLFTFLDSAEFASICAERWPATA